MKNLYSLICLLLIAFFANSVVAQYSPEQQHQIDSLNLVIGNPASHDTSLAASYIELSEILYISSIDTIKYLCEKAEDIATTALKDEINNEIILSLKKSLATALSNIGYVYEHIGPLEKALIYYHQALKMREVLGDKSKIAYSLNSLGLVYDIQGQIEKALEYYLKALKINEEINDKHGIATSFNNLGYIHYNQGQIEKALEYFHKSLKIKEKLDDKYAYALSLDNIGSAYDSNGDVEMALGYYFKALKIKEEIGDKSGLAYGLNNIGFLFYNQDETEKALEYFHKSLKIQKDLGEKEMISATLKNIGQIYYNEGNTKKAKEYLSKAHQLALELGAPMRIESTSSILYVIAERQGNYKEAFDMFQLYVGMRDSLNNEATFKALIQQNAKYEYEKQATADSIVNAEAEKVHLANLETEKAIGEKQKTEIAAQKKQNIYLFIGLGLVALFGFFMFNRFKVTQKQKGIIEDQKLEVETQKVTVEKTLQELESTHEQLEESHKEITDSINYAERIQRSFLATKETLDEHLKDYFVFFKPKEAVSGDFYWAAQLNNNNFAFTVADSTGHGVPGAIMSLLNITSLERSVETEIEPHNILNKTREIIINRLKKDGSEHGGKDGMDCNLMVLNQDKSVLSFASANNTIVIIRNGEILEFKGDKMPVGKHDRDTESFTLQSVQLQKGDVIYALTDGFPDQFGGPKGKKYMIKNLKNKFLQIADLSMTQQEKELTKEFENWKAENEQIDDVCIIGVRI